MVGVNRNTPNWMDISLDDDPDGDDEIMEEERTWRDPSAHKLRSAVGKWMRDDHQRKDIIRVSKRALTNAFGDLINAYSPFRTKSLGNGWIATRMNRSSSWLSANHPRWLRNTIAISSRSSYHLPAPNRPLSYLVPS